MSVHPYRSVKRTESLPTVVQRTLKRALLLCAATMLCHCHGPMLTWADGRSTRVVTPDGVAVSVGGTSQGGEVRFFIRNDSNRPIKISCAELKLTVVGERTRSTRTEFNEEYFLPPHEGRFVSPVFDVDGLAHGQRAYVDFDRVLSASGQPIHIERLELMVR